MRHCTLIAGAAGVPVNCTVSHTLGKAHGADPDRPTLRFIRLVHPRMQATLVVG